MSSPQPKPPWVQILAICVLWAATFLPNLGAGELDNEEGRRAWPAREMLESGDYVLPTIFGRPYLAKPPAYFWAVASVGKARGGVDEVATRLPAAIATLLTALAILIWVRRRTGPSGSTFGAVAAGLWLVAFEVHKKGALGELEAQLALFLFLSIGCLWLGRHGAWRWMILGGIALAGATLTKGPPALLFHGAALISLLWTVPETRKRFGLQVWVPFVIGTSALVIWSMMIRSRPEVQDALGTWQKEIAGRGSDSVAVWTKERLTLVVGLFVALVPASLMWLVCARKETRTALRADAEYRFVMRLIVIAVIALALTPGVRVRYAYPLGPWIGVIAGLSAGVAFEAGKEAAARIRWALLLPAVVSIALVFAPFLIGPGQALEAFDGVGGTMTFCGICFLSQIVRFGRTMAPEVVALNTVSVLGIVWLLVRIGPDVYEADQYGRRESAAVIQEHVDPDEPLWIAEWTNFNALFYVDRPLRWIEDPTTAASGDLILMDPARLEGWPADRALPVVQEQVTIYGLERVVVQVP
tara:strand:- start:5359 stop:6942 length:1584 start_codon:yes stop_codon:yes gene_type:complete